MAPLIGVKNTPHSDRTKTPITEQRQAAMQSGQVRPERPQPRPAVNSAVPKPNALQTLLALEGEALTAKDRLSVKHMAVNKPRALIETGHIFFIRRTGQKFYIDAISSQSSVEKNAPFIQWLTRILSKTSKTEDLNAVQRFTLELSGKTGFDYPFTQALWTPFSPDPEAGGMLYTRECEWTDENIPVPTRLAQIYGLQWTALGRKKRARLTPKKRWVLGASALCLMICACIPVPMTTLAQAEIVAQSPYIVSAPMDGVIKSIDVLPNTLVTKGDVLARFEDTSYRNAFALAAEEMDLASARLRQAGLSSFVDETTKREVAVSQAEQKLARSRQSYAAEMLDKTVLRAESSGLVIFSDVKDWMGRPVATGERIMEIAQTSNVEIRLEAPPSDSAALIDNARVRLFLDSAPINPLEARQIRSSYYAQPQAGGKLAYEAYAIFQDDLDTLPRIGGRGVAKIYGAKAPLGYWLLRRPITSLRQLFGL